MKAVVKTKPGEGLELLDVDRPVLARDDEALLKVRACGICVGDRAAYHWKEFIANLLTRRNALPAILGHELCGEIVELGRNVKGFKVGDRVTVEPNLCCGQCYYCRIGQTHLCDNEVHIGAGRAGGMTEYVTTTGLSMFKVPDEIPDEVVPVVEILATGMHGIERMDVKPGDTAVVLGAGSVGNCIAQSLKAAGAGPVIISDLARSEAKLELAKSLGADATIVADREDMATRVRELTGGWGADHVFEATGTAQGVITGLQIARKGTRLCLVSSTDDLLQLKTFTMMRTKEVDIISSHNRTASSWHRSLQLVASGKVKLAPIVSRVVPLAEALSAFQMLDDDPSLTKIVLRP